MRCLVDCNGCSRCREVAEESYCVFNGVKALKMAFPIGPPSLYRHPIPTAPGMRRCCLV